MEGHRKGNTRRARARYVRCPRRRAAVAIATVSAAVTAVVTAAIAAAAPAAAAIAV
jgi:hypothetical protein